MPLRSLPIEDHRADWVRLRTTIVVRWIAIAGQTTALLVAEWGLGIDARIERVHSADHAVGAAQSGARFPLSGEYPADGAAIGADAGSSTCASCSGCWR